MKKRFEEGNLNTAEENNVNSIIMEKACDIAGEITEKECEIQGIECFIEEDDETSYTEEAQDIFNEHYDKQMASLYKLVNDVLSVIK